MSHSPEADNQKAKLSNPEAITLLKECYVQHPDPDGCHDRAIGMNKMELEAFTPRCTLIRELGLGKQILLGGHWAADFKQPLQWHGVRAKCCLAIRSTTGCQVQSGMYHVQPIDGVREMPSHSWSNMVKHRLHRMALEWACTILETTIELGSVLIYDQRGAHRCAAGAVLLVALTTKDWTVEKATKFVRQLRPIVYIWAADSQFIRECLDIARSEGKFPLEEFRRKNPYAVSYEHFQAEAG